MREEQTAECSGWTVLAHAEGHAAPPPVPEITKLSTFVQVSLGMSIQFGM